MGQEWDNFGLDKNEIPRRPLSGTSYAQTAEWATRQIFTLDKYFTIRYRVGGVPKEERLGWASEEWTAEKAYGILSRLKEGITTGSGPESLAEKRKEEQAKREAERAAKAQDALTGMSLCDFLENFYMPRARKEKRSWKIESLRISATKRQKTGGLSN